MPIFRPLENEVTDGHAIFGANCDERANHNERENHNDFSKLPAIRFAQEGYHNLTQPTSQRMFPPHLSQPNLPFNQKSIYY